MAPVLDDLGFACDITRPARRIVSLVPSITESIAATDAHSLVAATDWCTHPADLEVSRVRGTKNPDCAAIIALSPDVVIANMEENREIDVRRLRDAGVTVWVTRIETVAEAITSLS
ncbi:MAG: helical backbone metal receptor, partial [bacterium]|nr:helical backbone metal receptor [bacterium]